MTQEEKKRQPHGFEYGSSHCVLVRFATIVTVHGSSPSGGLEIFRIQLNVQDRLSLTVLTLMVSFWLQNTDGINRFVVFRQPACRDRLFPAQFAVDIEFL